MAVERLTRTLPAWYPRLTIFESFQSRICASSRLVCFLSSRQRYSGRLKSRLAGNDPVFIRVTFTSHARGRRRGSSARNDQRTARAKTSDLLNPALDRLLGPFRNHRQRRHGKEHCNPDSRIRIVQRKQANYHPRALKGRVQRSLLFAPSASSGTRR